MKVTDGSGHSVTQAVSIGVLNVNEAPSAGTVNLGSILEDAAGGRDITAAELLAGVTDVDSSAASRCRSLSCSLNLAKS